VAGGGAVIFGHGLESLVQFGGHVAGAVLACAALLWAARFGDRTRPDRTAFLSALGLGALWCILVAALGTSALAVQLAAGVRDIGLLWLIYRLFAADGRNRNLRPLRPLIMTLLAIELAHLLMVAVSFTPATLAVGASGGSGDGDVMNLLGPIGALLLLHNLYAGASPSSRILLRWGTASLTVVYAYDLNIHAIAFLSDAAPGTLVALRGAVFGCAAIGLALGLNTAIARLEFRPSRAVTFHTLSLLVIGAYLALMALVTKSLALVSSDMLRASQIVFLVLACLGALVWLPSSTLRASLKVKVAKHLFQHRYDYREEWLRFTRTIGRGANAEASLAERAVKALADITESPAGLLMMPGEDGELQLTARWNWARIEVPARAIDGRLANLMEQAGHIIALDDIRAAIDHHGELALVPEWLIAAEDAWAAVPLIHFERLIGMIVLARPQIERRLDWEDFDLLKVVGQQLASYLAEQAGQQALMESSQFDEFNRRMAFVMHDIKNLASQMSLLAANAQKHADNPAFRADMLVTLRNSSDKLAGLLARLGRYSQGQVGDPVVIDLVTLANRIADRFRLVHPVMVIRQDGVQVAAAPDALEQALIHLVQNAVDASSKDGPVYLDVTRSALSGQIEVIDAGCGMSPEFLRTGLFKPFVSSKSGGFGIGAFEARELIRAMGGRVAVETREGVGTRFSITLPLAASVSADRDPGAVLSQAHRAA
jgi:putative PEP-CTERM system histidine kinase